MNSTTKAAHTPQRSEGLLALCKNCGKQIEFKGGKLYPWTHADANQNECLKAEPPADFRLMTLEAIENRFDWGGWDSADLRFLEAKAESHAEMLEALEAAYKLFAKDHALSRLNWGASGLRAEDIRELNELPLQLRAAIQKARGGQ